MNTWIFAGCMSCLTAVMCCAAAHAEWVNVTSSVGGEKWGYAGVCLVVAVPDSPAIIAGISEAGLWRSDDQGKSWRKLGTEDKEQIRSRPHQIVFDPKDCSRFWISGCYGASPFVTADAGKTFHRLGNLSHMDGIGIDFTDPQRKTLVVGLHEQARSAHKSTDGGVTWQKIGDSLPADSNHSTDPIVIDSKTFLINTAGWAQQKSLGTYRTEDGGATWAKVSDLGCAGRALLGSDGAIYWGICWGNGIVKSADKGRTWQKLPGPAKLSPIQLEPGKVAALGGQQIYVSSDGGQNWDKLADPIPFKPNGIAYNVKSKSLYTWRSTEKQVPDAIVRCDLP
ncbi:MAG: hypothetical protein NTU53_21285 [Planctomycetota bacterium]|nr:hypothetical protein [Planctomycetota bacterium]